MENEIKISISDLNAETVEGKDYVTGVVELETEDEIETCGFECNISDDMQIELHKYSEPGFYTGASYEASLPEGISEHADEVCDEINSSVNDYLEAMQLNKDLNR